MKKLDRLYFREWELEVGGVPPEICARQMMQAINDINLPYEFPQSFHDAQLRHQLLYTDDVRGLQR